MKQFGLATLAISAAVLTVLTRRRSRPGVRGPWRRRTRPVINFGGNIRFSPRYRYSPRNEADVLSILRMHADGPIRAIGSLHSWSDSTVCEAVLVDMRHFDEIRLQCTNDGIWATIGAGCRLEDLLPRLERQARVTLPSIPAVTRQSMAGAISTATHGSGMPSMSHFVDSVRIAAYDPETGEARVYEWSDGPELRAARCSLGCLGIILSVRVRCVPSYSVVQSVTRVKAVEDVLAGEDEFPLQQALLIPYAWDYFVFRRRALPGRRRTTALAYLFRAYWFLNADLLFHLNLIPLVNVIRNRRLTRWYLKSAAPKMMWTAPPHVDGGESILVLEHELFRHLEMELIVPDRHIRDAVEHLRLVTGVFAGEVESLPADWEIRLESIGMLDRLYSSRGKYLHHYPFLIRRILPDDTLISMTSGADAPYYSISLFTYCRDKSRMYPLADFLALSMTRLHRARLHWGKYLPLEFADIEPLYPNMEVFREICRRVDPRGVFRNRFARRVLGFRES